MSLAWYDQDPRSLGVGSNNGGDRSWYNQPDNNSPQGGGPGPDRFHPTMGDAFTRLIAAKLATGVTLVPKIDIPGLDLEIGPVRSPDISATLQALYTNAVNKALEFAGDDLETAPPKTEAILESLDRIANAYHGTLPNPDLDPRAFLSTIVNRTMQTNAILGQGRLDRQNGGEPTPEEKRIAQEITAKIGIFTPEQLRRQFDTSIFSANSDVEAAILTGSAAHDWAIFKHNIDNIKNQPPDTFFTRSWAADIVMSPEERRKFGPVIWGASPRSLVVKGVDSRYEDESPLGLAQLSAARRPESIWVQPGSPEVIDIISRKGGPLIRRFMDKVTRQKLGGLVFLRVPNRDLPLAMFSVEDGQTVSNALGQLGDLAYLYETSLARAQQALENPDAARKDYVRPNIVRRLIPAAQVVFEAPVGIRPNGELDLSIAKKHYDQAAEIAYNNKISVKLALAAAGLTHDGSAIGYENQQALAELDSKMQKAVSGRILVDTLEGNPALPSTIELFSCPHCGGPAGQTGQPCGFCASNL